MKKIVAVSVVSFEGLDSILEPRFGRAFGFVIVDANTCDLIEEIENQERDEAHGAGTGAAALLAKNGVVAVVSGRFGPQAADALENLGIEMLTAPDGLDVRKIAALYVAGGLQGGSDTSGMGVTGKRQGQGQGQMGRSGGGMGRGQGGGGGGGMGRGRCGSGGGMGGGRGGGGGGMGRGRCRGGGGKGRG